MFKPYCYYTSLVILAIAICRIMSSPTWTNALVLTVGVTSVMHHRRLDKWHYVDAITVCDWIAVVLLMVHMFAKYGLRNRVLNALVSYAVLTVLCSRCNVIHDDFKIQVHCSVHALFILALLGEY